jgi:hypothetical protein
MMLAIFNPFCCCTAAVFVVDDGEAVPLAHGCCQSTVPDAPSGCGSTDGAHDPADCPHQALKDFYASLVKDKTATQDVPVFLPAHFAVVEFMLAEPVAQSRHTVSMATVAHAPPVRLSQVYCVYRI